MFKKHILLFCLTYYIPKVNSMDEMELEILWNAIRGECDYIQHDNLHSFYKDEDPYELLWVLTNYGHLYTKDSKSNGEHRMCFKEFKEAVFEGRINICSNQAMEAVFRKIAGNQIVKHYVTYEDIYIYYKPIIPQLLEYNEDRSGQMQMSGGQKRLRLPEFIKAMNIGYLPKPWRDDIAIRAEIENLFSKMKNKQTDYVTSVDMSIYYEVFNDNEFSNIVNEYEAQHFLEDVTLAENYEHGLKIDEFIRAGCAGYIPRFSNELIYAEFMNIVLDSENSEYITLEELTKHYEKKIPAIHFEDIMRDFGENQDGQCRMDLYSFKRAINGGYLTDPLHNKIKVMYTLFKEILPIDKKRNHIVLDDMIKYYETKKSFYDVDELRRIFKKHGQFREATFSEINEMKYLDNKWNGGQYLLNFSDFKRSMNFEDLSFDKLLYEGERKKYNKNDSIVS